MSARGFFSAIGRALNDGMTAIYLANRRELARKIQYHGGRYLDINNPEDLELLDGIAKLVDAVETEARTSAARGEY